ncbi:uncharacterized protein SRS1_14074 [Sporisorium reilianum f. sp. reilianum]|uniref:Uncharacterized protein n=1 Tax=Sporisorium reilianum f. sp. reilianum TaxID=72559 RepID=A0A2N8UET1_9BASI|nr:uncharacterized protein SRS1_14074 [Sporisorium reilianum f. sp. reilianum]
MPDSHHGIHHTHRDYYSESSPIPSIQRFFKKGLSEVIAKRNLADSDSDAGTEDADHVPGSGGQPSELYSTSTATAGETVRDQHKSSKKHLSSLFSGSNPSQDSQRDARQSTSTEERGQSDDESANHGHQSPNQADKAYKRSRAPRKVRDPVTGRDTWVHDTGKREYRHTLARAEAGDKQGREEVLRSNLDTNLTSRSFPPATSLPTTVLQIDPHLLPLFVVWSLVTILRLVPAWLSVALNAWLLWWGWRTFLARVEDDRWHRERRRGKKARSFDEFEQDEREQGLPQGIAEGAEWLNGILEALWAVMNPELFSSLGGTLEDVMQASIPSFIHSVKVEDMAQGSTPLRITGLRILPDGQVSGIVKEMRRKRDQRLSEAKEADKQDGRVQDEVDQGEHYVNLELGFVYRARPTSNGVGGGKHRNAHLLIKFWLGARKLLMLPLPVWVEIKGFVGKVRARVQLTSDPPFVKDVTLTFCGLPRVGIEVVPLHINTSHIPFISSFIESSIDAAVGEFVMPSSLTLDVGEMLMGDNVKREVLALGVVVVCIHSATDLEKQDIRGSSDPYCTLSLAKVGKILYSTRVVVNELSPRWEERHVILVTREHLDSEDRVSIALWDSDRFSQDDMLGIAEVHLVHLARHPNKLFRRSDTLKGLDRERSKQGIVHWSLGFFSKAPSMRRESKAGVGDDGDETTSESQTAGVHGDDEPEHDGKEMDSESIDPDSPLTQEAVDREKNTQTRHQATAVDFEPPDPSLPSGILSMQIHHIANLEVTDISTSLRPRKKDEPGQDVDTVETEHDPEHAPSAYCRIILNDEIIFQTRSKALNSNPFYNAGTERFIRDWRRTLIMVVVYDFRVREADAILGVVPIKLSDLFKESSQVTRFFPLAGGVGHGRIRLSLLFRPIQRSDRDKKRLGWNIGTVRLLSSPVATDFDESKGASGHDLHLVALRAATLAGRAKIAASRARYVDRESKAAVEWKLDEAELPFKVPARRRYAAPYVIEFRALSALGKRKTTHMCIVWQQELTDDDVVDMRLPIWRPLPGSDFHRLRQNYHDFRNEAEAAKLGVERIGYLCVKMQFKSGLGKVHTKFDGNPGAKAVMDAWRCCVALGLRSVSGDFANARMDSEGYLEDGGVGKDDTEPGEDASLADDDDDDDWSDSEDQGGAPGGTQRSRSLKEKFTDWKAEKHELHRRHKGIKQYKPVRTVEWLGQSVKSAGTGLKDRFDLQDRRSQHVETEL